MVAITLVQKLWLKLDDAIAQSMSWKGIGKNKEYAAENVDDYLDWAQDRVWFLEGPAGVGRGLAEALVVMCTPAFDEGGADAVVALAMKRWQAEQTGDVLPQTPGFMGAGVSGKDLRLAGSGKTKEQSDKFSDSHRK